MKSNPVRWFEIYVQDMQRAKRFYEAVFQIRIEKLENPDSLPSADFEIHAFPMSKETMGSGGALVRMNGVPSGGNSVLVYFASDDCAIEAARVKQNGGRIEREKFSIGQYGFIALATDTEGNMFGIHSME